MLGCKGWQPTSTDNVTGPAGESAKTIVGNIGSAVLGEDGRNIGESLVALLAGIWLWRNRKKITTVVSPPTTP
jgi:hypothetical protein